MDPNNLRAQNDNIFEFRDQEVSPVFVKVVKITLKGVADTHLEEAPIELLVTTTTPRMRSKTLKWLEVP